MAAPIPPSTPPKVIPKAIRIKSAGTEAIAHLTMSTTMDPNGMLTSTTTTSCRLDGFELEVALDSTTRDDSLLLGKTASNETSPFSSGGEPLRE